jgi:hypothetical protein
LESDLAAHRNQCVLAYWHHPRFSSGAVGNSPGVGAFWNALYAARADVVLNGHDHMYERFAQQAPSQAATNEGIREFVVGTGGESLFEKGTVQPNMQAFDNGHFGALFLTLHRGSYEWAFRATDGTLLDSGSTTCHAQPAGTTAAQPVARSRAIAQTAASKLPAVAEAGALVPARSADSARLAFAARPAPATTRAAAARGVPVDVYCSRACDVTVVVLAREGHQNVTIASYRETESQIPRASSRIWLRLPPTALAGLRHVRLSLSFTGVDASNESRSLRRTITLASR